MINEDCWGFVEALRVLCNDSGTTFFQLLLIFHRDVSRWPVDSYDPSGFCRSSSWTRSPPRKSYLRPDIQLSIDDVTASMTSSDAIDTRLNHFSILSLPPPFTGTETQCQFGRISKRIPKEFLSFALSLSLWHRERIINSTTEMPVALGIGTIPARISRTWWESSKNLWSILNESWQSEQFEKTVELTFEQGRRCLDRRLDAPRTLK